MKCIEHITDYNPTHCCLYWLWRLQNTALHSVEKQSTWLITDRRNNEGSGLKINMPITLDKNKQHTCFKITFVIFYIQIYLCLFLVYIV